MTEDVLADLRQEIDEIDSRIITLLARRLEIARDVAQRKEAAALPVIIPARVEDVLNTRIAQGETCGIDPGFTRDLFNRIIWEMCQQEARLLDRSTPA